MKTFRVVGEVTISMSTVVKANTAEEAKAQALDRPMMGLCHQCATGEDRVEWVTSGEFDGSPVELLVEEET